MKIFWLFVVRHNSLSKYTKMVLKLRNPFCDNSLVGTTFYSNLILTIYHFQMFLPLFIDFDFFLFS